MHLSSPGLDRPIKNYNDFVRNKNKKFEITLYKQKDGNKKFVGYLKDYTASDVVISVDEKEVTFPLSDVALISPVIEF